MSHSPTSYIDGLPVKISERYKPPPKMSLPQKLAQLLADSAVPRPDEVPVYDFRTEHAHRQLLADWQTNRHQDHCARRQRLHRRQLERQREHDEREKQKLTAVSYPSADELSSGDDDDNDLEARIETETETTMASGVKSPAALEITSADNATESPQHQQELPARQQQQQQTRFDTILMPTIMPATTDTNNWTFATSTKATARVLNGLNGGGNNINWSDFENDTSSPFDTIELTAINDLDMLAQVLNLNATPSSPSPPTTTCDNVQPHSMSDATAEVPQTPPPITSAIATTTTNPNTTSASTVSNNPVQLHQQQPIQIDNARNVNALDAAAQMTGSPLNGYIMGSPTTVPAYYNGYQMPPPPQPQQQQQQQQQRYVNYSQQLGVYQDQPVTVHHQINQQQQQHHQHHHPHHQSHAGGYNGGTATAVYHMHSTASSYSPSFAAPIAPMAGATSTMPFNVMGGGGIGGLAVGAFKATSVPDNMRHPTTQ